MNRDYSIDVMKCLAALLITYSHLEPQMGKYAIFATGGSFGDSLFFFCSGYTLLLSRRKDNFTNWYKRRINRIYPTVFAWALVCASFFHSDMNMAQIITSGGGFFVSCIMIFYIMFYFIKNYTDKYTIIGVVYFLLCYIAYFLINKSKVDLIYSWTWSMYFLPMLLGAVLGKIKNTGKGTLKLSFFPNIISLIISILSYYILIIFAIPDSPIGFLKPLIILPQLGFTYSIYQLCQTSTVERIYRNKYFYIFIRFIGALCLEIYIVQPILIHWLPMNELFPVNILLIYAIITFSAYMLKCLGNLWQQTFKEADYDWKAIVMPW